MIEKPATPHIGLDIPGYQPQSDHNVALVTHFNQIEEQLLREMDVMADTAKPHRYDMRWLSIARTNIEQGFMALNRSVFRPTRVRLPGDEKPEDQS